jgi:hypothetical protein
MIPWKKMLISTETQPYHQAQECARSNNHLGQDFNIPGAIYELNNPVPGRWTLSVATGAGKFDYVVRGLSSTNIGFEYYFAMVPKGGRKPVPVNQRVSGKVTCSIAFPSVSTTPYIAYKWKGILAFIA